MPKGILFLCVANSARSQMAGGIARSIAPADIKVWSAGFVGGNNLMSNFIAAFVGMLWYFAILTEIPIVEMLMRLGMGKRPAWALLPGRPGAFAVRHPGDPQSHRH